MPTDRTTALRRKAVKVYVPTWYLFELFTQENKTRQFETIEGLPKGAIFASSGHDTQRDEVYFIFTHESFKEVPEGGAIPELRIRLQNAYQ